MVVVIIVEKRMTLRQEKEEKRETPRGEKGKRKRKINVRHEGREKEKKVMKQQTKSDKRQ